MFFIYSFYAGFPLLGQGCCQQKSPSRFFVTEGLLPCFWRCSVSPHKILPHPHAHHTATNNVLYFFWFYFDDVFTHGQKKRALPFSEEPSSDLVYVNMTASLPVLNTHTSTTHGAVCSICMKSWGHLNILNNEAKVKRILKLQNLFLGIRYGGIKV